MSIVRDLGITLEAMTPTILITCAEALSTAGSTTPSTLKSRTTADVLVSTGLPITTTGGTAGLTTGFGRVIDRTAAPLSALYAVAMPAAEVVSTRGSTEANRQVVVGIKLQHGDSSGGGDMADYSTDNQPADRIWFSTARTCDQLNWEFSDRSTGTLIACSNPAYYDLRNAKQYIRTAVRVGKSLVTTESSGDEHARVLASITFLGGDSLPQVVSPKDSPYATATATA